jgi:hypothetical protein
MASLQFNALSCSTPQSAHEEQNESFGSLSLFCLPQVTFGFLSNPTVKMRLDGRLRFNVRINLTFIYFPSPTLINAHLASIS